MPRNVGTLVENNFSRGLITEATGLNFPENAVTATDNCIFDQVGSVRRRKGIDVESEATTLAYDLATGALTEYLWRAVALTGSYVFLVLQIGENISFFEMSVGGQVSNNLRNFAVDLNNYRAPGAGDVRFIPCAFASGNGRLFIAHPQCDPIMVRYNEVDDTLDQTRLQLQVRDFEGIDDGNPIDFQPSTLTNEHWYNLKNQGWNQMVRVGSSTASE